MSKLDIVVYDAICGQGKTKRIKQDMLEEKRPIIYITPLLEEAYTVVGAIVDDKGRHVRDDEGYFCYDNSNPLSGKSFMLPNTRNSEGSKLQSVKQLIDNGANIASTHQLFSMFDYEIIESIKKHSYVLIVDEALNVWNNLNIYDDNSAKPKAVEESEKQEQGNTGNTKTDKEILNLIANDFIVVDPVGLLHWQEDKMKVPDDLFFGKVKRLCDLKQLYLSNNKVVFWELNNVVLSAFSKMIVGTYMFKYSYMSHYLDVHGFEYNIEYFGAVPSFFKPFVNLQAGKINDIGDKKYSLSYSDLCVKRHEADNHPKEQLRKNLDNFFKNKCNSKTGEGLWTCFKKVTPYVSNRRYTNDWVNYNIKATNKYRHIGNVAYLCNNFPNTFLVSMVSKRNNREFDQDMWALSEMLQYIFRSKLRGGCEDRMINLYIPSKRMRELFLWWLDQTNYEI